MILDKNLLMNSAFKVGDLPIFFRFLKDNGIYKLFFRETNKNKKDLSTLQSKYKGNVRQLLLDYRFKTNRIIDVALDWNSTDGGMNYWETFYWKYIDFINEARKNKK